MPKNSLPESFKIELTEHFNELFAKLCELHQGNAVIRNLILNKTSLKDLKEKHEMNEKLLSLAGELNQLLNNPQEYEPLALILDDPNNPKPIKNVLEKYNIAELKRRIVDIAESVAEIFLLKREQNILKERVQLIANLSTSKKSSEPPKKRKQHFKTRNSDMATIIELTKRISKIEEELKETQTSTINLETQVELLNHVNSTKDKEIKMLQQDNMKKRKHEDSLKEKDQTIKKLRRTIESLTSENHKLNQENQQLVSDNKRLSEDKEFYKGARKHFKLTSASYREENQDLLEKLSLKETEYDEKNYKLSEQLTQNEMKLKRSQEEIDELKKQSALLTNSRRNLIEKANAHGRKHLQKAVAAKNANPPQHLRAANQARKALTYFFHPSPPTELFLAKNLANIRINKSANNQEAKQILDKILNNQQADRQIKQQAIELKQEIIQKYPNLA